MFYEVVEVHMLKVKVQGSNLVKTIIHCSKLMKGNFVLASTNQKCFSHLIYEIIDI